MEKGIISKHYMNYLGEMIKAKSQDKTALSTEEEIFDKMYLLAEEKVSFGDEKVRWLPLNTKKMVAKMIDASCFVNYDVKRNGNIVTCEAKFYWSDDKDHPAGIGFVARDITQRIASDADARMAETEIEALVRGAAASRALTDAGIGIEFYSDSFDTLFSSVEEAEAEEVAQRKQNAKAEEIKKLVPEVPTKEELKKKARAAKQTKATTVQESQPEATEAPAAAPVEATASAPETAEQENTPEEKSDTSTDEAPVSEANQVTAPAATGEITVDLAKLVVATKGNYTGQPLGTIQSARSNALVWYAQNDTPEVCEAAKVIIYDMGDQDLIERLNKALSK